MTRDGPGHAMAWLSDNLSPTGSTLQQPPSHSVGHAAAIADAIREEARTSWAAYAKYAAGFDTLRPISRKGVNDMGGIAVTAIDSLDTLYLMNLTKEYKEARQLVERVDFSKGANVNTFETTIRCLGGLLSAHALSGGTDTMLLDKAVELGSRLLPAFAHSQRIPHTDVDLSSGRAHTPSGLSLAEAGTLSLEFLTLARVSGRSEFAAPVHAVRQRLMQTAERCGALLPLTLSAQAPNVRMCEGGIIGLGARGDSYFEYLAKEFALDRTLVDSRIQFQVAIGEIEKRMLVPNAHSGRNRSTFVAELIGTHRMPPCTASLGRECARPVGVVSKKMDHLVCFLPAAMAVALHHGALPRGAGHMRVAQDITETCMQMYQLAPSGLAPEIVKMHKDMPSGSEHLFVAPLDRHNLLRPEVAEALYFMWMLTGRPRYRRAGGGMFHAFRKTSRLPDGAYTSLKDIYAKPDLSNRKDEMPSWWLAETLKYLWLLFKPRDTLRMDDWVFNTEAHPLPTFASRVRAKRELGGERRQ